MSSNGQSLEAEVIGQTKIFGYNNVLLPGRVVRE